ncbi:hypothetical protein [Meridianimarinicoccus aquatilis]|uniref:MipA/OmpV family protein n=1 Tax=Meridianimarinicoccus aquatilis TaxID=2552766 RepID=A0A4R6B3U7_9RHOB|nr:hypothetical protein [Fluviibacterium aquatile]TDL91005.1 hypothetical protein E2L05_03125 [Fluviibacterium aquatile]
MIRYLLAVLAVLAGAAPSAARPLDEAFGALAVLGLAAAPSKTTSALVLDTGSNPERQYDFQATQLGGGFRISDNIPLYLEGYIGANRYDPVLLFSETQRTSALPFKWTSIAPSAW